EGAQYDGRMHWSFWEQDALPEADFIVVGAGLVGLQTAIELHGLAPRARIVVLERSVLPNGASTRNAGFACFGSPSEILHDFSLMGEDAALQLIERRWRGLQRLRQRLGDGALGYDSGGGYELLTTAQLGVLHELDALNRKLHPIFGGPVFQRDDAALAAARFGSQVSALVSIANEAQLHPGRMMAALAALAQQLGITLYRGVQVLALEEADGGVVLSARSSEGRALRLRAGRVALCTNGALSELAPDCGIRPARGQVLLTEPLADLPWRGSYHMEQGFYYFREVAGRVLLGGGRQLDPATETSADPEINPHIQQALDTLLRDIILPGRPAKIELRWAGIMGFSEDKQPRVRRLTPRVALGFGCNGMGVALSAETAAQTARLLVEEEDGSASGQVPKARRH
ncbi:MAG TPA: FAD-dependent oxidoreductase, partial [Noviherbaspirillum sp.]